MNKSGYTLLEILLTVIIVSIIGAIATVSYRGYILTIEKKELKNLGVLFATTVNTCITKNRGWTRYRWTQGSETCPTIGGETKKEPCIAVMGCKASNKAELKSKLNFTCPADATCNTHTRAHTLEPKFRYTCLSIEKKASGKKLQLIARIPYENPSDYQLLCGEMSSYVSLGPKTCKKHSDQILKDAELADESGIKPCPWK